MKSIIYFVLICILFCSYLQGQNNDQLRQQLIKQIDRRLANMRKELILEIDKKLRQRQHVYLGAIMHDIPPGVKVILNIPKHRGVFILDVEGDSPAQRAGLQKMDILLSFAGRNIRNLGQLQNILKHSLPDRRIKVVVLRQKRCRLCYVYLQKKQKPYLLKKIKYSPNQLLQKFRKQFTAKIASNKKNMKQVIKQGRSDKKITELLDDIIGPQKNKAKVKISAKYIGFRVGLLPPILREKEKIRGRQGLMIVKIFPLTPAARAGVRKWDILLSVNGRAVSRPREFYQIIKNKYIGMKITLILISRGHKKKVVIQ